MIKNRVDKSSMNATARAVFMLAETENLES